MSSIENALKIKIFDFWTVKSRVDKTRYLLCECKCGVEKRVRVDSLLNGESKSCGCKPKKVVVREKTGIHHHRLYARYKNMIGRCYNESNRDYRHYGGRGIDVCDRWKTNQTNAQGFRNFLDDMESTFLEGLELERSNVDEGYSPENCIWADRRTQTNNLRTNRQLDYNGVCLSLSEWGFLLGLNSKILGDRINKLKHEPDLGEILGTGFKRRGFNLLYNGEIKTSSEIFESEGISKGRANYATTTHGGTINALKSFGIEFEVLDDRVIDVRTFEEGLEWLKLNQTGGFEKNLLDKIQKQMEDV